MDSINEYVDDFDFVSEADLLFEDQNFPHNNKIYYVQPKNKNCTT